MKLEQLRELANLLRDGGSVSEYTQATAEFCRHAQELLDIVDAASRAVISGQWVETIDRKGWLPEMDKSSRDDLIRTIEKLQEV